MCYYRTKYDVPRTANNYGVTPDYSMYAATVKPGTHGVEGHWLSITTSNPL